MSSGVASCGRDGTEDCCVAGPRSGILVLRRVAASGARRPPADPCGRGGGRAVPHRRAALRPGRAPAQFGCASQGRRGRDRGGARQAPARTLRRVPSRAGLFDLAGIGPLATRLAGTFAPGDGPALLDAPGVGPVLPLICYEAIFPQDIARVARPRAILHLTNDAWFGRQFGLQQHLALARLRAAESGLPVLRAANTGISASIDARGTVRASLPLQVSGHLDPAVPLALPPTPYLATGDWAALLLFSLLAACCLLVSRRIGVVRLLVRP
ncbi:apolipoprotein N-acyltransferase [uncultured Jannaschia sp.]|uniref:apolipoprotein N-acyltransferase n=1 Tax=uncultured Jannaschia sp. TaxID=293347 RepID=UPI00345C4115